MANQLFGNNLKSTLSLSTAPGSLTPAATVFTLVSGGGNNWPTPSAGDYVLVTLYEVNGQGVEINHEVVKVTNRTADTFTIGTRDFEQANSGVGRSFPDIPANNPSGLVYAALRYTAYAAGNTLNKDDNLASLASVATARTNIGLGNVDNTSNATERAAVATLTNKTIALGSNTVSGTLAQFNTAVTDADLASLAGVETLTNKTIVAASNTITTAVSGNLTSTNLNAALAELQTDIDTRATSSALTTHTGAATGAHAASAISYAGGTGMTATDVEAAIDELATEKVSKTSDTGSAILPVGTTAQRDAGTPLGYLRYNTTLTQFEGYGAAGWGKVGGGATGGGSNAAFYENDITVTDDYTITTNKNAMTAGPITIADTKTVTVPTGSTWSIV